MIFFCFLSFEKSVVGPVLFVEMAFLVIWEDAPLSPPPPWIRAWEGNAGFIFRIPESMTQLGSSTEWQTRVEDVLTCPPVWR